MERYLEEIKKAKEEEKEEKKRLKAAKIKHEEDDNNIIYGLTFKSKKKNKKLGLDKPKKEIPNKNEFNLETKKIVKENDRKLKNQRIKMFEEYFKFKLKKK